MAAKRKSTKTKADAKTKTKRKAPPGARARLLEINKLADQVQKEGGRKTVVKTEPKIKRPAALKEAGKRYKSKRK